MPAKRKLREILPSPAYDSDNDMGFTVGKIDIPLVSWFEDASNPPTAGNYGTASQSQFYIKAFAPDSTDEIYTAFKLPGDYYGNLKLKLQWNINSTTTTQYVVWVADVNAIDAGEAVDGAGTTMTAVGTAPSATAYQLRETEIELESSSEPYLAHDLIMVHLYRDHDHSAGGAAGVADEVNANANLISTTFTYDRCA